MQSSTENAIAELISIDENSRRSVWLRHLYAGVIGVIGACSAGLLYAILTWNTGPHRFWIAAIAVAGMLQAVAVLICRGHFIADGDKRTRLFMIWNIDCYALIAAAAALDGGLSSPIALVWVLPTIYLVVGFPKRAILYCGSIGFGLYLLGEFSWALCRATFSKSEVIRTN